MIMGVSLMINMPPGVVGFGFVSLTNDTLFRKPYNF